LSGRGAQEILSDAIKLAREYYLATGKPLGITGELGEYEAARLLELELAPPRAPGFDATDKAGRKYQIKSRAVPFKGKKASSSQKLGGIKLSYEWDAVLLVIMNQTFETIEIWVAERPEVKAALLKPGSKARNERGALTISKFKNIGRQVWPSH
jgi:hypothetical protein